MAQKRNRTGIDFEKQICETNGWVHKSASPKINWSGKGRSNFDKIVSVDFDSTKFLPNIEKSKFEKYDAINNNGDKIELKKYNISQLSKWVMYSEPIFKVASRSAVKKVTTLFGAGDYEKSKIVYNNFVKGVVNNVGEEILDNITKSNIGIQFKDGFVSQENIEYRWKIRSGWMGYDRLSIEFRVNL